MELRAGTKKAIRIRMAEITNPFSILLNKFYDLCWLEPEERMAGWKLALGVLVTGVVALVFLGIFTLLMKQ